MKQFTDLKKKEILIFKIMAYLFSISKNLMKNTQMKTL